MMLVGSCLFADPTTHRRESAVNFECGRSSSAATAGRPPARGTGEDCRGASHPRLGIFPSRAARGLAAIVTSLNFRAGAFLLPCARPVLFGAVMALSGPALAGGLDEVAAEVDPCPPVVRVDDASMTADMLRQWGAVRRMSCPDLVPVFIDRATGEPLSREEILRRVFNGSRIPAQIDAAVIPVPGAVWGMLAGIAVFGAVAAVRRRRG